MHIVWQISFYVVIILSVICIPIQHRALNRIAFGRSMFICYTAIVMGYVVGVLSRPSIASAVVGLLLLFFGVLMLVFMSVKSLQHLNSRKR